MKTSLAEALPCRILRPPEPGGFTAAGMSGPTEPR
jgi:hypothetical protein